jgi:hypothetical protein
VSLRKIGARSSASADPILEPMTFAPLLLRNHLIHING